MGNRNSSRSKVHGHVTRVASTELGYDSRMVGRPVAKFRDEYIHKPKAETLGNFKGTSVYSEQQYCNTPLDDDETFTSFIQHAKYKITTMSHIDQEQSNAAPAPPQHDEANAGDNQNDQFSNFILNAKKKLRTTSTMRNNGSFSIA